MAAIALPINLIARDEQGRACIAGTSLRVATIATARTVHDLLPEAIQQNYPNVTLEQIYAALSYYYGHRDEIDAQIAEADRFVEQLRQRTTGHKTRAEIEATVQARQENAA